MKGIAVAVVIVTLIFVTGCQNLGVNLLVPTPPEQDVCLLKPAETKSWLCEAAAKAGVSLNSLDGLLLDSSAVGVILTKTDIAQVAAFLTKVDSYLNGPGLTYELLISRMQIDAAQAVILQDIMARHIQAFASPELISSYDLTLIRAHLAHQKAQFGLK